VKRHDFAPSDRNPFKIGKFYLVKFRLGGIYITSRSVPHFALAILCLLMSCLNVGAQISTLDKDPRIGTWTLNLEKSRFAVGNAPKMQVRRVTSRAATPENLDSSLSSPGRSPSLRWECLD